MNPKIVYSFVFFLALFASLFICLIAIWNKKTRKYRLRLSRLEKEKNEQLLKASIDGQELERKRMAEDLHDDIGPLLSALKLQINSSNNEINIQDVNHTLNETVKSLRNVSSRMSPSVLEELGLNKAIKDVISRFKAVSDIELSLQWDENIEVTFNENVALNIYRIIQEALNNIIKHSKAETAYVSGIKKDKGIIISIGDNGLGSDATMNKEHIGLGIKSMEARCEVIQADFKLKSTNKGTVIIITYEF